MKARIQVDGRTYEVEIDGDDAVVDGASFKVRDDPGTPRIVRVGGHAFAIDLSHGVSVDGEPLDVAVLEVHGVAGVPEGQAGGLGPVHAPMTGTLAQLDVKVGQDVQAGDVLFVLEAMKMRNEVKAAASGRVTAIHAKVGQAVDGRLAVLELGAADA